MGTKKEKCQDRVANDIETTGMKSRNMMYTQFESYLPRPIDEIYNSLIQEGAERIAWVKHDKDINTDVNYHVMMTFKNARYINHIAKIIGDKPQYIECKAHKTANDGFSYLIHRTESSRHKHQYNENEVIANFDYPALMRKIEKQMEKNTKKTKVNILLDAFRDGNISKGELTQQLKGSQYGGLKHQIDNIEALIMEEEAEEWRQKAMAEGKTVNVIWIYGMAGSGKSRLAQDYAKKQNRPYYITGSSRDMFQSYRGEHTVIIDDLRAGSINYEDFLKLTDPYAITHGTYAPSRYFDKPLAVDLVIITSPLAPENFYRESVDELSRKVDRFDQLIRRLQLVMYMYKKYITQAEYNEFGVHVFDDANRRDNPYVSTNNLPVTDSKALFDDMLS